MNSFLLPKDDHDLPDCYSITFEFHNGRTKEIEVAYHRLIDLVKVPDPVGPFTDENKKNYKLEASKSPFIEYVTKDDIWGHVPVSSFQSLSFDKRYSKIMAINKKLQIKAQPEVKNE